MPSRTIAIGDIHGCSLALASIIDAIQPDKQDTIVPLGDFVDRGLDSRGVIDQLIALQSRCQLVPLLGNHEEILLAARHDRSARKAWHEFGGIATLDSYGFGGGLEMIPREHIAFMESCRNYYETDTHFFVHANYLPELPLDIQPWESLRWKFLSEMPPRPHCSGRIAIVGHTTQTNGEILDRGFLKCIDTNCCEGGWLTALDVFSRQAWQANERGDMR